MLELPIAYFSLQHKYVIVICIIDLIQLIIKSNVPMTRSGLIGSIDYKCSIFFFFEKSIERDLHQSCISLLSQQLVNHYDLSSSTIALP